MVVLDFGRNIANHWEFVRYAHEQHLDLDFAPPPKLRARQFRLIHVAARVR